MNTEMTKAPLSLNESNFILAQRQATALSTSSLVPEAYRGNVANCLVALEIAHRIGASPLLVAQNLNIIYGRPSWSSQFIIAALNSCGRFSPLRFGMTEGGCIAWAYDKDGGEKLEGPEVTMEMAKAEGWLDKNGSKWKTMPDLMLRYRAAAFFGRLYAPDVLMGMHTVDEVEDFSPRSGPATSTVAQIVNQGAASIAAATVAAIEVDVEYPEPEPGVVEETSLPEGIPNF